MGKQVLRTLGIYSFAMIVIILFVLFPRTPEHGVEENLRRDGTTYTRDILVISSYSVEKHWNLIKDFFTQVVENKSLGTTNYKFSVEAEVVSAMKKSLTTILAALTISFIFGIAKGFFDFKMQRKKLSFLGNWTTWIFQSIPDFFIILFVQLILIRYLPITRFFGREGWDAFVLPALLVAIFPTMYIARITATALGGQVGQLYILVARAKGLTEALILYKHIFRNCIGTILAHLPSLMIYVLSNLLMVEYFMSYPGAALRLYQALDYDPQFGTGIYYEPGLVIGLTFGFMLLILTVQLISIGARKYFEPSRRGND